MWKSRTNNTRADQFLFPEELKSIFLSIVDQSRLPSVKASYYAYTNSNPRMWWRRDTPEEAPTACWTEGGHNEDDDDDDDDDDDEEDKRDEDDE